MRRAATATLAAFSLAFTAQADASPASTFRAAMNKRCGDSARWYCKSVRTAYCGPTTGCNGTYVEGDIFAGSRTCWATARADGKGYRDGCHK